MPNVKHLRLTLSSAIKAFDEFQEEASSFLSFFFARKEKADSLKINTILQNLIQKSHDPDSFAKELYKLFKVIDEQLEHDSYSKKYKNLISSIKLNIINQLTADHSYLDQYEPEDNRENKALKEILIFFKEEMNNNRREEQENFIRNQDKVISINRPSGSIAKNNYYNFSMQKTVYNREAEEQWNRFNKRDREYRELLNLDVIQPRSGLNNHF